MGAPAALVAQRGPELVIQGVQAYQRLDLDAAATMFRTALATESAGPGAVRLSNEQKARALTYLGATELFRKRPDAARLAFRRLLELDPASRVDPKLFPPPVTELFDAVRRSLSVVAIGIAPVTRFRAGVESLPLSLAAHGPPTRTWFRLEREDGTVVRYLFDGVMKDGDSLTLGWAGLVTSPGGSRPALVRPGRYRLTLTTQMSSLETVRAVRVPITIESGLPTLAPPRSAAAPSPQAAEPGSRGNPWRLLIVSATAVAAAVTLPRAVSPNMDDRSRGLVVPIAIGTAGLVGILTSHHGRRPSLPVTSPVSRPSPAVPLPSATPSSEVTLTVRVGVSTTVYP